MPGCGVEQLPKVTGSRRQHDVIDGDGQGGLADAELPPPDVDRSVPARSLIRRCRSPALRPRPRLQVRPHPRLQVRPRLRRQIRPRPRRQVRLRFRRASDHSSHRAKRNHEKQAARSHGPPRRTGPTRPFGSIGASCRGRRSIRVWRRRTRKFPGVRFSADDAQAGVSDAARSSKRRAGKAIDVEASPAGDRRAPSILEPAGRLSQRLRSSRRLRPLGRRSRRQHGEDRDEVASMAVDQQVLGLDENPHARVLVADTSRCW